TRPGSGSRKRTNGRSSSGSSRPSLASGPTDLRGDEARIRDLEDARGPLPSRLRPHDLEPSLEERGVRDEGLELPALPARAHAEPSREREQLFFGCGVEFPPKPLLPKPFRGDRREHRLDPRLEVVPQEPPLV